MNRAEKLPNQPGNLAPKAPDYLASNASDYLASYVPGYLAASSEEVDQLFTLFRPELDDVAFRS